ILRRASPRGSSCVPPCVPRCVPGGCHDRVAPNDISCQEQSRSEPPMNRPIARRTVAAEAAEVLRQRILSGDLRSGQPIRQEQIAQERGVSRIPLREALKQLEAEGFVTIEPHKGAIVSTLSLAEVEELFELRIHLESWLLRDAIPRMREGDFAQLD